MAADGGLNLRAASLDDPAVQELLARHFQVMRQQSPEESCHVMDDSGLRAAGADILGCWEGARLLGIGALTRIGSDHGEIKSMHTAQSARGRGVARALLRQLTDLARAQAMTRLSLETGTADSFAAARALYASEGFAVCAPFGTYRHDPLSVFMTRTI